MVLRVPPGGSNAAATVSFYLESDLGLPILTMKNISVSPPSNYPGNEGGGMTLDKRLHLVPFKRAVVAISKSNDQLLLYRFDLLEALEKQGSDYLMVISKPPAAVKRGSAFEYAINVLSKKGGLTYTLESGPPGMTVSPSGVVSWIAPLDDKAQPASALITVRDSAGQERFHTFTLTTVP